MAVTDGTNTGEQQPQQQQDASANRGYASANNNQPREHVGMSNVNSMLQRSGSYDRSESRSADALRGLRAAADSAIASQQLDDSFELVRFDRDANRVGLPALLVLKTAKVQGEIYASVRTLVLDSEGIRLRPKTLQLGPQRIESPTRPQDVFNDVYWARIVEFLRNSRGIPNLKVVDAGPLVVPTDFDFNDPITAAHLVVTSVNRVDDIVARIQGETPFSVAEVKRSDERLTARIDFSGQPQTDIVGHPLRSDIVVTMNRQANNSNVQEDDYYERENSFNSVSGYMNLEYAPPQLQQPAVNSNWNQPQPTQLFSPTFVITDVSQADWIRALTPELYLLAIANAYRVTAGTQWVRSFLPQVGRKGVDPRDIGALGYMTQAGQKIETKSDSFSEQDFVELVTALVRPNPTFLLDVNPVGDHAVIEMLFMDSAFQNPNQQRATARLISAADNLTGGLFSQKFDARQFPLVVPYEQEVHLGYYLSEDGEKRDIRDLDVLAMLNLTQGNTQDFIEWYRTYCDQNVPSEIRLQQRERMERNYLSKSLTITGRATRLLLSPQFIEALDAATREAGVQVDFENVTSVMGAQRFIGNTMVNNYAVGRNATMGYAGQGQQFVSGQGYTGGSSSGRMY